MSAAASCRLKMVFLGHHTITYYFPCVCSLDAYFVRKKEQLKQIAESWFSFAFFSIGISTLYLRFDLLLRYTMIDTGIVCKNSQTWSSLAILDISPDPEGCYRWLMKTTSSLNNTRASQQEAVSIHFLISYVAFCVRLLQRSFYPSCHV